MEENSSQSNKYDAALTKYNTNLSDADIQARVADLIEKKVPENNTEEVKKLLFNCIDLTTLNSTDSDESVMHFTEKVNEFDNEFPDMKNVAAICVYPNFADIVKNTLQVDDINIACVSGGFPSSQTFIEVKVAETALAIADGADEIDIVISIGKFLSGDYETMCEEIQELKEVCKERHLKVNRLQHQESLYPIHVFGCRFHQDIDRKATACRYPGSRLCDVRSYQGVLSKNKQQDRLQTGRRHQHRP